MAFAVADFVHAGHPNSGAPNATPAFAALTGDLIIVACMQYNPSALYVAPTDNVGGSPNTYTLIGSAPGTPAIGNGILNIWFYACTLVTGSAGLVVQANIQGGGNDDYSEIVAWRITPGSGGASTINTFQIGGNSSGGNAPSTAPLTTTVANTIVVVVAASLALATVFTQGADYALDMGIDDAGGLYGAQHQQFSSIQTGITPSMTSTAASSAPFQIMAVAIAEAAALTYSISGNAGVADATVAWTGTSSGSTTADGSGNYTISGLANGSYTISASLTGWSFTGPTPANPQVVSGADITGVNFTATQIQVTPATFSPVAGRYATTQTVTLSNTDSGLSGFAMYYTTDGSTPTTGSTQYTTPISVSSTLVLKVLSVATSYANSNIASAFYIIGGSSGGSVGGSKTFSTEDFGASITSPNTSVMGTNTRTKIVG